MANVLRLENTTLTTTRFKNSNFFSQPSYFCPRFSLVHLENPSLIFP